MSEPRWRGILPNKVNPVSAKTKRALAKAAKALQLHAPGLTAESKAYEAWFAFEAALGLRNAGATVTARDHTGVPAKTFNVRGGPGNIPTIASTGSGLPCHFGVDWNSAELELHISLNHEPDQSHNRHELDISVVKHEHAEMRRYSPKPLPYAGPRAVGVELKAYDKAKWLDKNIPRALLGLILDLDPATVAPSIEIKHPSGKVLLSGKFMAPQYFLLTTALMRPPSKALLDTYGVKTASNLFPSSMLAKEIVDELVEAVEARLQRF
jgi:hypothetical protein